MHALVALVVVASNMSKHLVLQGLLLKYVCLTVLRRFYRKMCACCVFGQRTRQLLTTH